MKNSVIYKLSHKFHRVGFYLYYIKFYCEDNRDKNIFKCFLSAMIQGLKIFDDNSGYYEYLEIPITTKCSLMCKKCSNLIPCYNKRSDYDINIITESINRFLCCINNIVFIRVLGGEPFLSNNLYSVLKELLKSNKIQRIEVVTNGTIVPNDKKIIKLLKNTKIIVSISQYPFVDYNKLVLFLQQNNIKYRIDKMNYWMDYGKPYKRNKSNKELIKQFSLCNNVCRSLVNGQIHLCPRSSHGTDLGIITDNNDDYVNLLDENLNILEIKENINKLYKKKYIVACDYCDFGTKNSKKIPVAEQINSKKNNN